MSYVVSSKFKMRGLELGNGIVVSAMGQYSAENGCATGWHMMHLGHLSVSGAALLITEATAVEMPGRLSRNDLGLWSDENEEALARIIAFCRKYGGAKLGIQLYHGGPKGSISTAWEGQRPISKENDGAATYAPPAKPPPARHTTPHACRARD